MYITEEVCHRLASFIHIRAAYCVLACINIYSQHSVRRENELVIYMAPAMDENSLYAQFAEIRVKCLSRNKIKYVLYIICVVFIAVYMYTLTTVYIHLVYKLSS